jgi:hypothetical protein
MHLILTHYRLMDPENDQFTSISFFNLGCKKILIIHGRMINWLNDKFQKSDLQTTGITRVRCAQHLRGMRACQARDQCVESCANPAHVVRAYMIQRTTDQRIGLLLVFCAMLIRIFTHFVTKLVFDAVTFY